RRVHAVHHEPDEPRVGSDVDELRPAGVGQVARLEGGPARTVATRLDREGVDAPGRRGGLRDAVLALVDGQVRDVLRGTLVQRDRRRQASVALPEVAGQVRAVNQVAGGGAAARRVHRRGDAGGDTGTPGGGDLEHRVEDVPTGAVTD